jgi:hypothetical protein
MVKLLTIDGVTRAMLEDGFNRNAEAIEWLDTSSARLARGAWLQSSRFMEAVSDIQADVAIEPAPFDLDKLVSDFDNIYEEAKGFTDCDPAGIEAKFAEILSGHIEGGKNTKRKRKHRRL